MEHTLIVLKPDAVQRKLTGKIISRFEEKGLLIIGLKMTFLSEEHAKEFYSANKRKDFYAPLIRFVTSSPVILLVLKGNNAIKVARKLVGSTFGQDAEPGTIRGDYAISNRYNIIHCSDSPEAAEKEINLLFGKEELLDYDTTDLNWIYDASERRYA